MADKGIIFSAPMVRALLAGSKTQTRRLLRNPEYYGCPTGDCPHERQSECDAAMSVLSAKEAGYATGDRLYVRESFFGGHPGCANVVYRANQIHQMVAVQWKPSIHMPRWASRLWLAVTDVLVQRLQEISAADCYAEGIMRPDAPSAGSEVCARDNARNGYRALWNSLHTKPGETWADNPWIVGVTFNVRKGNIDSGGPSDADPS